MTSSTTGRSVWSITAGFMIVVVLSTIGDLISKAAGLVPSGGSNPTERAFIVFTAYRLVFTVLGGAVTARLAPARPMKHALILGSLGTLIAIAGAVALASKHYGPEWYAWGLVVTAIPFTWLGAKLAKA